MAAGNGLRKVFLSIMAPIECTKAGNLFLLLAYHESRSLLVGHDDHIADLYPFRLVCYEGNDIGNILCLQRIYAFIYPGCPFLIAMETDFAERGLHNARLDGGHLDITVYDIDADTVAERSLNVFTAALVAQYTAAPA